jgi:ferredoxin
MIVAKTKSIEEIASSIADFKKVLIVGCGSCVTVSLSGGDKEARALARDLSNPDYYRGDPPSLRVETFQRQCERDLLKAYLRIPEGVDAILSLACGAGVQSLADVFDPLPVIPALNTTFLGALDEPGLWREKCVGCGDCLLTLTGGICPLARCAKRLLNGPCGGSSKGKCEIGEDVDCAWQLIVERLAARGRLEDYEKINAPRDWSLGKGGGPRSIRRASRQFPV